MSEIPLSNTRCNHRREGRRGTAFFYRKYRIKNVEPGEYALSAYHDLNNSGKLERSGFLGIPQEPIGFPRLDVQKVRRHPKWDEVKFRVGDDNVFVPVHLVDKFGL